MQQTQEEYRDVVQVCRDGVKKDKAHLELNLSRYVKGNKKCFSRHIGSKRKTRENMGVLLNGNGDFIAVDMGKAEELNDSLTSVFIGVELAFGKSMRPLRQWEKSGAGQIYPHWRRIKLENI